MFTTDFIHYAIDCISNSRGRVETQDACNLIIAKAPGIVEYLKGRLPNNINVAAMSPTQVFVAFTDWVTSTVGKVIQHKLTYTRGCKQLQRGT